MSKIIKTFIITITLLILLITFCFAIFNNDTKSDKKVLRRQSYNIMVGVDDNTSYEQYFGMGWPKKGYVYNSNISNCINNLGEQNGGLSFNRRTREAIFNGKNISYCYLFFDIDNTPPVITEFYLANNKKSNIDDSINVSNTKVVSANIKWVDSDVEYYCVTESNNPDDCKWIMTADDNTFDAVINDFTFTSDGEKKVYAYLKDFAENISVPKEYKIIVDTEIPEAKVDVITHDIQDGSCTPNDVEIKIFTNKVGPSGSTIYYCEGDSNCDPNIKVNGNNIVLTLTKNGLNYIKYKIISGAGLESVNNFSVNIDKQIPIVRAHKNPKGLGKEDYNFENNLILTFGCLGRKSVSCTPSMSNKKGQYYVSCFAVGNNNLMSSVTTFLVRHSYAARSNTEDAIPVKTLHCKCNSNCTGWLSGWQGESYCNDMIKKTGASVSWSMQFTNGIPVYKCNRGSLEGTKCKYYTCPDGGYLSGSTCYY